MERTLIIFKPDAIQRGVVGEILARFEKTGLKVVGMKMVAPSNDHFFYHYETVGQLLSRKGQQVFNDTLALMQLGPVIAVALEGVEAVEHVRKMVGSTEPKSSAPGTIRGDYAHVSYAHADSQKIAIPNLIHASGNSEEAKAELAHWFAPEELYDYKLSHEHFVQPKNTKK